MEQRKKHTLPKLFLIGLMLFVLGYPMVQHKFRWIEEATLNGDIEVLERPVFSKKAWLDGTYQEQRTEYLNENVGFRNHMVRTYNQIYFTCFNAAKANGVVIGKENYLYEKQYIDAYFGKDFQGEKHIKDKVYKLAMVSDTLAKLGKHLVVMLAPGKASFFPEFIPRHGEKKSRTNLSAYEKYLSEFRVKTIHMNRYFIQNKGKTKYPLFPRTGIHWSKFGEVFMADTLISYLNHLDGIHVPKLKVNRVEVSDSMRDTDDDIEKGMNIWNNIPDYTMGYPIFSVDKKKGHAYSKILTVADSYYWGPFNWGMSRDVFNGGQFWYYNELVYPESLEKELHVKDISFQKAMDQHDAILLVVTDANLYKFGFGFVEQAYNFYFHPKKHE